MEMDPKTIETLRTLEPKRAWEEVRRAVLQNPWGASSDDLRAALRQVVDAGILTWEEIEAFEDSRF
jgi:hypothetical protein